VQLSSKEFAKAGAMQEQEQERARVDDAAWRDVFERMQEGFFVAEAVRDARGCMIDFRFVEVNRAFQTLTGLAVQDVVDRSARQAIPGLQDDVIDAYARVVDSGEPAEFELHVPALHNRWYEARAHSLGHDRFSVLFLEITARKQAEARLVQSEERFRLLADSLPEMVWIADLHGNAEFFNRQWEEYTGVDHRQEPASQVAARHIHLDDRAVTLERFARAIEAWTPFEVEHRIRSAQGEYRWFLVRAEPYIDPATGQPVRWYGSSVDIHDRKLAEEALRLSEQRYRALFDSIDEAFCILHVVLDEGGRCVDYRYLETNPAFERQTGLTDAVGRSVLDLVPNIEAFWFETYGRVALTGQPTRFIDHAESMERWFDLYAFRVGEPEERKVAVLFTDITQRKQAEAKLRESQARQAFLVALTDRLGGLADPLQIQYEASALLAEHLEASRAYYVEFDEAAGSSVVHRDYQREGVSSVAGTYRNDDFADLNTMLREGHPVAIGDVATSDVLSSAEKAQYAAIELSAFLIVPLVKRSLLVSSLNVSQVRPRRWTPLEIALVKDTAERTWASVERARAEATLRAADRRKDEFLATLAHELRNPLAPLRNGLQIARLLGRSDARLQRTVEMMDRQLTHMVRLVDDLLDVGRVSSGKLELRRLPVSLSGVLADSLEATRTALDARQHKLVVDAGDADLQVLGDADRLTQVVVNLLTNAAKYTKPGGRIRVKLRRDGSDAVLCIEDNGIGIPPEDLVEVFELFSQVRVHQGLAEGGLGIGLALVRSLVALHGGQVHAYSEGPGHGSMFTVRLPLMDASSSVATAELDTVPAIENDTASASRQRVLVVDDNRDAAASLAELVRMLGHEVALAHDGVEALEQVERWLPDLVFLDLGMPRMGGLEVARRLRERGADRQPRLIALTGWGQEADRARTREAGFDHHAVKPVDLPTLRRLLLADATTSI
jgi:PAS domain S-box-containing protein